MNGNDTKRDFLVIIIIIVVVVVVIWPTNVVGLLRQRRFGRDEVMATGTARFLGSAAARVDDAQ